MKICLLGDNGSVHVQKWVHGLSLNKEIDLHVVALRTKVRFENVTYHELKSYLGNKADYIFNIPRLKKIVADIKPDILHSHYATSYGFMGAVIGFHPYIITGWGSDIFDSPKNHLMRQVLKYSLSKADALTVLTQITLNEISKFTDKRVELVPFGVDINKFVKSNEYSRSSDNFRIGTIRTLSEKYGVEYLIRAFEILYHKHPSVHLNIVGDGPQRFFLEKLTVQLGINDRVIFHGYISQTTDFSTYIKLLQSFDVFAIPSILDSETFGVAAVEASSCSIPVIGTDIGGLPDVVDDFETGLIVPVKDASSLADAIEKIFLDKELAKKFGESGRKKVERLYNWNDNVKKMEKIYMQILSK